MSTALACYRGNLLMLSEQFVHISLYSMNHSKGHSTRKSTQTPLSLLPSSA